MWWLWPHLRRLWAGVGTVTVGLVVTCLYSWLSEQPLPHSRIALQTLDDYWLWLGAALLALTTLSVFAERAHRRHSGQPAPSISEYLPPRFRSRPYLPWLAGGLGLLVALIYGVVQWRASNGAPGQAASQMHPIHSIAVLPLDNFSGDPKQEYFADAEHRPPMPENPVKRSSA
jgi:hypothetical protein